MSDPRAYEQLLGAHLRREDPGRADSRLAALERRIAELTAELAQRDAELERSQAEATSLRGGDEDRELRLSSLEARLRAAEDRLRTATAEREAALRELDRKAEAAEAAERRAQELEAGMEDREDQAQAAERALDDRELELDDLSREVEERDAEIASLEAAVAELQQARDAAEQRTRRVAEEYRARVRELEQLASTLAGGLAQTKQDIDRAAGSRAWRWGHGATKALRRLTLRRNVTEGALARALKRIEQIEEGAAMQAPPPTAEATVEAAAPPATVTDERSEDELLAARSLLAAEIRERLGPPPQLPAWPAVSIVVPTRNGREHLERLLAGLRERTDYSELELIVVDNGSDDGSLEFLAEADPGFPLRVIANEEPATFSAANNRGVVAAEHDLILFLNNDIEPFEPGWLRELVAAHRREGVVAAGATLLRSPSGPDPELRDRTVQHRAVKFRMTADGVRAYNADDGADLFAAGFGTEERVPAVTAAAMLVTRERFEDAGGFSDRYRFGTEDVDLGLKLTAGGGEIVATGRSVLYHRESVSQDAEGRDFKRNNRLVNRRVFLERWGPQVRRSYRLGRLRRDPGWTDGAGPHVAITVTALDPAAGWGDWYTAHEIGDALAAIGWRVTYVERRGDAWYDLPGDLDYLLALMDPFDLSRVPPRVTTIAWIRNWTERWLERPWFDRADVLLVSSARSREIIEEATGRRTIPFPLASNPARFRPLPGDPDREVDYVFTGNHWGKDRDVQAGLEPRPGERLAIYGKGWDEVPDLAPHWRGAAPYDELPAVYSGAKLVLDDTSGPTLPYGAVNSRVFDALAAGTLPITNCESGVRELFGPDFPVWSDAASLRAQLDALLGDEGRREALARRFRSEVLRRHTYAHRARRLVEVLEEHEEKPSFCIKIGAPTWEVAEQWGDLHFARAIQRDLRRRGHPCVIQVLEEWENDEGLVHDVALVIRGLSRHLPKPGQVNVLWNISHPADLGGEECDGYDLVCVASERFAEDLRGRTSTPVIVLEQATDPAVFYRDPAPEYAHELVFVANSRNVLRPIVRDLLPTDRDLAIYGGGWDGLIDTRYVVAEHVANEELRKVYSSARVVLCDHWDDMREHGFVSNRIYDALACGATVISDAVPGLERFEGVLTYETPEELERLVDEVLGASEPPRGQLPAGNSFADRVEELLAALPQVSSSGSIRSKRLASSV